MEKSKVTPWEVEGKVDYDKLIKEFGVEYITKEQKEFIAKTAEKKNMPLHLFIRRNLFFAQKDFNAVIEKLKEGKDIFLYTGRAPGGSMHIGHLIPFLFTKYLQDIFDCRLYIQIPDDEKFLFKKDLTLEIVNEMLDKDLKEIAAIGFNPDKTFIFRNTQYISKMYPLYMKIAKRITFSQARNTFGFNNDSNIAMINYPALQITPTLFEKNICLIPCAIDQNPYFMLQRDYAEKIGNIKNATILSKFLTSLTGPQGKMSASDPNKAIHLTDMPNEIKKKINKFAYSGGRETIEDHRKYGGNTQTDVAYQWLYYLFEDDDIKIQEIKEDYESGKMLSGEIKKILIDKINTFLELHRNNKEKAINDNLIDKYMYRGKLAKEMWSKNFYEL